MSELPDEVRAAIGVNDWLASQLRILHDAGLILWASELRDEATIERAARAMEALDDRAPGVTWDYFVEAAFSAVLGSEERPRDEIANEEDR